MTLSQVGAEQVSLPARVADAENKDANSPDEYVMLRRAAEAGLPAAQLGLAQWYLTRRSSPQDLVQAYMWYLVATERALQSRSFLTKMMTPEQVDEAQERASIWLSKLKHTPPALADSPRLANRPDVARLPVED